MKMRLGWIWLTLAITAIVQVSSAQEMMQPYNGPVYEQGSFQPTGGDLQIGMPGRMWIESNIADRGLGYQGSYLTLGAKNRLFEDMLDGRWLGEIQGHYSIESGGFFGNVGIERVMSIRAAGADVSLGGWFDYDDDLQGDFAHTFTQAAINASIKTKRWDLIGNGYFPLGTANYAQGDPTGVNCFLNHSIVLVPGIDSALRGFDATLRMRPTALGMVNGTIDIGGYGYSSDLIEFFGGGRVRLGMQILRGMIINAEVNHDDRFDTTGVLQVGYLFGVNARGNEYSPLGRDLEPTLRNDHIVRFQQDVVLAIDPDTGVPYNVFHVDNTADVTIGDGRVETPFTTLLDAQNASGEQDIIFVREGDGTSRGMNNGIVLKDGQLFLGDGVRHLIPIQDGRFFELCNDIDGVRPTIAGRNNNPAVTLANDNTVRGFNIDGSAGGMTHGIFGDGVALGAPITNGIIEDNVISGAILHGVFINDLAGDWTFARNSISGNGFDGILLTDACDPDSIFLFDSNNVSSNGRDGIHMVNYDAERITFLSNITNNNGRDGVRLENFKNTSGEGLFLDFLGHQAIGNSGFGINVIGGDGFLRVLNSNIQNNLAGGVRIFDWTNTNNSHITLIGTSAGGTSSFLGNGGGAGAALDIELNAGVQRVLITNNLFDGNGVAVNSVARGLGTSLRTQVLDNVAISNQLATALSFGSFGGASHDVLVDQTIAGPLVMDNNGDVAGESIRFLVGDASGNASIMNAVVRNVAITNSGNVGDAGVLANVFDDANFTFLMEDSTITGATGTGLVFNIDTNPNLFVNSIVLRNMQILNSGNSAVALGTGDDTFVDLGVFNTNMDTMGGHGFNVFAAGDGLAGVDNRTRIVVQGSTITNAPLNGFNLVTVGDANVFLELESNAITNNGQLVANTLPFFHGVNIDAGGDSVVTTRMSNNLITQNFERGVNVSTSGNATVNALLTNNNIGFNDQGEDPTNDPIQDQFISDATFANGAGGNICLAMSNNFFAFPVEFFNAGAPAQFLIELDGLSNGFGPGAIGAGFTIGPFSAVCVPTIDAIEAAFIADGFPPRN